MGTQTGSLEASLADLSNPHDLFFKEVFARPEAAADFIANYVPENVVAALDLGALELVKDSFVDADLQQHFSDLLYRIKLKEGSNVRFVRAQELP